MTAKIEVVKRLFPTSDFTILHTTFGLSTMVYANRSSFMSITMYLEA